MSEDERKQYDQKQMSIDQRNACFLWSLIYLAGAIASYLLHPYMVVIAFLVWLFSFAKMYMLMMSVHLASTVKKISKM